MSNPSFNPSSGLIGVLTRTPMRTWACVESFNPSSGLIGVLTLRPDTNRPLPLAPFQSLKRVDRCSHLNSAKRTRQLSSVSIPQAG